MTEAANHKEPKGILDLDELLAESDWVRRLARSLMTDEAGADDLTQDVLAAAITRAPGISGLRLRGWLGTVTRRKASRAQRRAASRADAEQRASRLEHEEQGASERLYLHGMLTAAIEKLAEPYRVALVMRYFEDLQPREIAVRLCITPEVARKRVSRGLALLREQLDGEFHGDRSAWFAALAPIALLPPVPVPLPPVATISRGALSASTLMMAKTKLILVLALACMCGLVLFSPIRDGIFGASPGSVDNGLSLSVLPAEISDGEQQGLAEPGTGGERVPIDSPLQVEVLGPRVRVVSPSGMASSEARVAWLDSKNRLHALELDENGTAPRPEDTESAHFFAHASIPGRPFAMAAGGPEAEDIVLALTAGLAMHGRVLEDGNVPAHPIPLGMTDSRIDPLLGLDSLDWPIRHELQRMGAFPKPQVLWTRSDGTFTIDWLRAGATGVLELPLTHILTQESSAGAGRSAFPFIVGEGELVLKATALPVVRGRLVWADTGVPVRGSVDPFFGKTMDSWGSNIPVPLAPDGSFALGMPSSDKKTPMAKGEDGSGFPYRSLCIYLQTYGVESDQGAFVPFQHLVDLEFEESPFDLGVLFVERGTTVTVRTVTTEGAPIPGATVASNRGFATTDEQGIAELPYLWGRDWMWGEGKSPIFVLAEGYRLGSLGNPSVPSAVGEPIPIELVAGSSLTVKVDPDFGSKAQVEIGSREDPFEGSFVDEYGDIAHPWGVHERFHGDLSVLRNGVYSSISERSWYTTRLSPPAGGQLVVPGLKAGSRITLEQLDLVGEVLVSRDVTMPANGKSLEVDLRKTDRPYGDLVLALIDAQGEPVLGGRVTINPTRSRSYKFTPSVTLHAVGPIAFGTYNFAVRAAGYLPKLVEGFEFNEESFELQITLDKPRSLEVRFEDESGELFEPAHFQLILPNGEADYRSRNQQGLRYFFEVPHEELSLKGRVGMTDFTRKVDATQQVVTLTFPKQELVYLSLTAACWANDSTEVVEIEICSAASKEVARLSVRPPRGPFLPGGTSQPEISSQSVQQLPAGIYDITVSGGAMPSNKPFYRRQFVVRIGERLELVIGPE